VGLVEVAAKQVVQAGSSVAPGEPVAKQRVASAMLVQARWQVSGGGGR